MSITQERASVSFVDSRTSFCGPVLIVDDDTVVHEFLTVIIEERGWLSVSCSDAEEALALVQTREFPIALLDWNLPGMDGMELSRRMRALPQFAQSMILLMTGEDGPGILDIALAAGADDYLPKPMSRQALDVRLTIAEARLFEKKQRFAAEKALLENNKQLEQHVIERTQDVVNSQAIYRSIMDNLSVGILFVDASLRVLQSNPQMRRWFSDGKDVSGSLCHFGFHGSKEVCCSCPILNAFEDGRIHERIMEYEINGSRREFRLVSCPVLDETGNVGHVIELVEDVTERLREEALLRDRLERAEQLMNEGRLDRLEELVGGSKAMNRVYAQIKSLATSSLTTLLYGETGTGKELTARALHNLGPRRKEPFISVNCGSLPESILESELFGHTKGSFTGAVAAKAGLFAAAGHGTIFLDEIEAASLHTQVALLRVLDQHEIMPVGGRTAEKIHARIIVASNQDLEMLIAERMFREDLFFRINQGVIELPALRDHAEDLSALAVHFFEQSADQRMPRSLSPRALALLERCPWPGNVREFRNLMLTLMRTAPRSVIRPADLPEAYRQEEISIIPTLADQEKKLLQQALSASQGNKADAARLLGISRNTIYSLMRKHRLED